MSGSAHISVSRRPAVRERTRAGYSLVELLVAATIAGVVLAGAWAWLWNAGVASSSAADRARATTAAAFAVRCIADDLEAAASLQLPPAPYGPARALDLVHLHPGQAPENVLVVWDPTRRVLWRKASGTYLADHVSQFAFTYLDEDGRPLSQEDLVRSAWPGPVARVAVRVVVSTGRGSGEATCDVTMAQR